MRESAALARRLGLRLHTHLAETEDEARHCQARFGQRPLELDGGARLARRRRLVRPRHPPRRRLRSPPLGRCHDRRRALPELERPASPPACARYGASSTPARPSASASTAPPRTSWACCCRSCARRSTSPGCARDAPTPCRPPRRWRSPPPAGAACLGRADLGRLEVGAAADLAVWPLDDLADIPDPVDGLVLGPDRRVAPPPRRRRDRRRRREPRRRRPRGRPRRAWRGAPRAVVVTLVPADPAKAADGGDDPGSHTMLICGGTVIDEAGERPGRRAGRRRRPGGRGGGGAHAPPGRDGPRRDRQARRARRSRPPHAHAAAGRRGARLGRLRLRDEGRGDRRHDDDHRLRHARARRGPDRAPRRGGATLAEPSAIDWGLHLSFTAVVPEAVVAGGRRGRHHLVQALPRLPRPPAGRRRHGRRADALGPAPGGARHPPLRERRGDRGTPARGAGGRSHGGHRARPHPAAAPRGRGDGRAPRCSPN